MMKSWSQDCLGRMKAVLFLDTNILSYLVDDTYPQLTKVITSFKDTCVVDLISSEYCQLEFVGIRKREHYLREVIRNTAGNGIIVNCSSLLKYHNQFDCREVQFEVILPNIRSAVNNDMSRIVSEFGIDFCCKIHEDLFLPVSEICLHSKISKEDSFVIVSAVNPLPRIFNNVCFILTHDQDFCKWHAEAKEELNRIYTTNNLPEPIFINQRNAFSVNWDKNENYDISIVKENFMKHFIYKNRTYYLGRTIQPTGKNAPKGMFAVRSSEWNPIFFNKYITIIGKNLDFSITTPTPVQFYHRNVLVENGQVFERSRDNIITAIFMNKDSYGIEFSNEEYEDILSSITSEGNYVFYHCDTFD